MTYEAPEFLNGSDADFSSTNPNAMEAWRREVARGNQLTNTRRRVYVMPGIITSPDISPTGDNPSEAKIIPDGLDLPEA